MNNSAASPRDSVALYLDLMKRCLTDFVYINDPFANYGPYGKREERSRWKEWLLSTIDRALRPHRMRIFEAQSTRTSAAEQERRALGQVWPVRAHTMIGLKRLDNLQSCVEQVLRDGIPGDLIETGVWRGGACIFMRAILQAHGDTARTVWVADSIRGPAAAGRRDLPGRRGRFTPHLRRPRRLARDGGEQLRARMVCSTNRSASCKAGSRTRCPMRRSASLR